MLSESPRVAWLSHYQVYFYAFVTAMVTFNIFIDNLYIDVSIITVAILAIASMCARITHASMLCKRCLDSIPDDAAVQVIHKDWALRLVHWERAYSFRVLFVVIAMIVINTWVPGILAVVWVWLTVEAWSQRFHEKVIPWCKYCKGDFGNDVEVTDPVPAGTKNV